MKKNGKTDIPVDSSIQAEANSAHAAINVALNLENWTHLESAIQDELIWYHQHLLSEKIGWKDIKRTLGYDKSTVFRVLKGTYEGSWETVTERIREYRAGFKSVQRAVFARNRISDIVSAGIDYAVAVGGIVEIIGESGHGKTCCAADWQHRHNSGRTTMVEVPPSGGHRGFLSAMVSRSGANKNASVVQMEASILRAYSPRRVLILDEAHRLLPTDRRSNPQTIEFIRHLHDTTGVPIAMLVTSRFDAQMRKLDYMFEQFLGRIDVPVMLPRELDEKDWGPLLEQYLPDAGPSARKLADEIANKWMGRMRALGKLLKLASSIAMNEGVPMDDKHFLKAKEWRHSLEAGEIE
jgi:DNA transposition AAA+ family ATPase